MMMMMMMMMMMVMINTPIASLPGVNSYRKIYKADTKLVELSLFDFEAVFCPHSPPPHTPNLL